MNLLKPILLISGIACGFQLLAQSDTVKTEIIHNFEKAPKEGNFKYYHSNGSLSREGNYLDSEKEGIWKTYDSTGKLYEVINYKKGEYDGDFLVYYASGKLKRKDIYENGKFVAGTCFSERGKKIKYFDYFQQASFKGGKQELTKFLSQHLKYPDYALDHSIEGKVWLKFDIDEKGKLSNVTVIKKVHPTLDEEALRVVSLMPDWIPEKADGVSVKSDFFLPINFKLH